LRFRLAQSMSKRNTFFSLILGAVFSGIALYFTFKNIHFADLFGYINTINYWYILPSLAIVLLSFLIRVVRWQLILSPVKKVQFKNAFHPLMIGFMINSIFPGRIGEIARPAIFSRKEGVSFSKSLATVGAERVFDTVTLILFFLVVVSTITINPDVSITFGGYTLNEATLNNLWITTCIICLILISAIIMIVFKKTRRVIGTIILWSPNLLFFIDIKRKEKIRELVCFKAVHVLDNLASGFEMMRSLKDVSLCFLISIVIWITVGVSFYVMAFGCPGINISFLEMCAVLIIICFFIALPSVPGFWGLFEAGGVFGMMIFGIAAKEAAGFTLVIHFFQIVPVILIGLASAVMTGANLHVSESLDS
jgi:uncharacterized protein (TIRG00374 family)